MRAPARAARRFSNVCNRAPGFLNWIGEGNASLLRNQGMADAQSPLRPSQEARPLPTRRPPRNASRLLSSSPSHSPATPTRASASRSKRSRSAHRPRTARRRTPAPSAAHGTRKSAATSTAAKSACCSAPPPRTPSTRPPIRRSRHVTTVCRNSSRPRTCRPMPSRRSELSSPPPAGLGTRPAQNAGLFFKRLIGRIVDESRPNGRSE
jgi:hypothetical protein